MGIKSKQIDGGSGGGGPARNDITTTTTLTSTESGKLTTNKGASSVIEADLPTTGSDLTFYFLCSQPDQDFRIDPGGSDQIILPLGLQLGDGKYVDLRYGSHLTLSRNSDGDWETIAWGGEFVTEGGMKISSEGSDRTMSGWMVPDDATAPTGYGLLADITYTDLGSSLTAANQDFGPSFDQFTAGNATWEAATTAGTGIGSHDKTALPYLRCKFGLSGAFTSTNLMTIGWMNGTAAQVATATPGSSTPANRQGLQFDSPGSTPNTFRFVHVSGGAVTEILDTGVTPAQTINYEYMQDFIEADRVLHRLFADGTMVASALTTLTNSTEGRWVGGGNPGTGLLKWYGIEVGIRKVTT